MDTWCTYNIYIYRGEAAEPQDRAFARKMSQHGSPFSCLAGLRSLKLDLHELSSAEPDCDGTKCFLQPISCLNNLQGFTLLGSSTDIGIQNLSQLSQLTSLGVGHMEDGLSTLVKLKHLQAAAVKPQASDLVWEAHCRFSCKSCHTDKSQELRLPSCPVLSGIRFDSVDRT